MNETIESSTLPRKKFQTANVTLLSLSHGVQDTYQAFFPAFLPIFLEVFSLNKTQGGVLSAIVQIPSLVQPIIGYLSDQRNLRWVVILSPAVTAISMSLLGILPDYWIIALLLFLSGLSSAGIHAVGPAITGGLSGDKIGRGMSFWMVGGEIGRALGPFLLVSVIEAFGLSRTPFLMIFGIGTSILLYYRLRKIPTHFSSHLDLGNWLPSVKKVTPLITLISIINLTVIFLISGISTFLPIYLIEQGSSLWFAGAAYTLMQISGVVGAMLSGTWSDRLGRKPLLVAGFIISPLSLGLFVFSSGFVRIIALLVMGFAMLSLQPVLMAWIQQAFPEQRALAISLYNAITFVVRSVIVIFIGWMGDQMGLRNAFLVSAAVTLVGLVIILLTKVPENPKS